MASFQALLLLVWSEVSWLVNVVLPLLHSTPGRLWVSTKVGCYPGTWASTAVRVDAPGHGIIMLWHLLLVSCGPSTVSGLKFYLLRILLNWTSLGLPCSVRSWQTRDPNLPPIMLRGCSQAHHISSHCPDIAHIHTQNFSPRLLESPANSWLANQWSLLSGMP